MTKVDKYCRLCAELTEDLIYADEEAAFNSKIAKKMLWINIDVSPSNKLPKSICYSCFDQLERTWIFLKNVREAQEKLNQLFSTNSEHKVKLGKQSSDVANPVDMNWDDFQDVKVDIKDEDIMTVITTNKFIEGLENLKTEQCPENDQDFVIEDNGFSSSTDSEQPSDVTVKKKRSKKKVSQHDKHEDKTLYIEPIDIADLDVTWEEEACRCAHCDAQCKNISLLRLHSQHIHNSCCIFKCVSCGKVVSNYKSFVKHLRLHKEKLNYCCEYCDQKFTMTKFIKRHKHVEHGSGNLTCCRKCGMIFDTVEQLHDHLEKYNKSIKKMFRKAIDNVEEQDLKCNHCHKEFKKRTHLNQHKLVHTDRSRDFSCHICGKMFFMKGTLSTHIMTHENVKPFKCEFCPMAFKAKGNLQSHITLHSGTKPFVCEQCGKSFRVKRHLKSHSIIHTDLMPYKCQYCDKTFRFKTRLNLHLRQHTGAKPYNCAQCQRDFTNGSNYKKHMKRRHNIDTSSIWKKYLSNGSAATEEGKDMDAGKT
ncbi:Zinc finger protein 99 [Papilio machaon]|uniref:Zinc finger protein 99 n=1 Tax=Papilio machaon TaxID=76193 RepID=A0A0N1IEG0_PAPMA|nr:Zinc finger protein 99 [Papilio machaon]